MNREIEATFVDIDKAALRQRLTALGAELIQPEILMQRVIFDLPGKAFARVRNEGDKITMTYKRHHKMSLSGTEEVNLVIDSYDAGVAFLKGCGLTAKAEQETLRESWRLGQVEFDIDTWPWLPAFVEVEGPSEDTVKAAVAKLGFDMADAHYGSVDQIYRLYYDIQPDDINYCPEIKFTETPAWLEAKRRPQPLHH